MKKDCPISALEAALAFHVRDWSLNSRDAFIYGVVCGWDEPSFKELKASIGWSDETVKRINYVHNKLMEMKE